MTGNITANDLAYYCPPVPSFSGEMARPAGCRPISEPTVYFIAESVSESLRWINIAFKRYNREKGPSVFYQNGRLVWIARDEKGSYHIYPLDRNRLRFILADYTWLNAKTREPCKLSSDLLDTVISTPPGYLPHVPVLKGLYSGGPPHYRRSDRSRQRI